MNYHFGKGLDALARCAVEETVQMLEEIGITVPAIDAEEMILRLAASDRFSKILLDMSDTEDSRGETFLDDNEDEHERQDREKLTANS